jgi:hypothetical protein
MESQPVMTLRGAALGFGSPHAVGADRAFRLAMFGLAVCLLLVAALFSVAAYGVVTHDPRVGFGKDFLIMRELGRRWLTTGTMYLPYQLAAPYSVDVTPDLTQTPALYPPAVGPVFALLWLIPFPIAAVLWWSVPIGLVIVLIARWRPRPWSWPLIAACLIHPMAATQVMVGGTALWMTAFVAGGLVWGWPGALVLLKPTMLPFALAGIRSRWWWPIAAAVAILTVVGPFMDYLKVAQNASESGDGLMYSVKTFPMVAVPVIAWLARTRRSAGVAEARA